MYDFNKRTEKILKLENEISQMDTPFIDIKQYSRAGNKIKDINIRCCSDGLLRIELPDNKGLVALIDNAQALKLADFINEVYR